MGTVSSGKLQGVILEELHFSLPLRNQETCLGNRQKNCEIIKLFMLGKVFKIMEPHQVLLV